MKKSLLALAALGAFASAASAQSTVTLSGSVDLGIQRANGVYSMTNGGSSRTNFTLSGSEDLGGGMRAVFLANHRFNANNGTARDGAVFWRQAWVGLSGGFGTVTLGKQLPPLQILNGNMDPWVADYVGSVHTGGSVAGHSVSGSRYNNSILYTSPSMGGLQFMAIIAAADDNAELTFNGNRGAKERPLGLGIDYSGGPVRVSLAYDRNADDKKTLGAYASYTIGAATLMTQFEKFDSYLAAPKDELSRWSVGAKISMGAAVVKLGYAKWSDENRKKFGVGADYFLSKRTNLYVNAGKLSGNGLAGVNGGGTLNADARKARFDMGVQHRF